MIFSEHLNTLLENYGIPAFSPVKLSDCKILYPRKLSRLGIEDNDGFYVCMIIMPYFVTDEATNISHYAKSRDYHLFFEQMSNDVISKLKEKFPNYDFFGFADNSPIDEVNACVLAGLGIMGKNNLLITEKYSSFVFIGEIITNYPVKNAYKHEMKFCENCGACKSICPKSTCEVCLSRLTQKKGELSEHEIEIIKKYNSAWGCDMCQMCCPHTLRALENKSIYTNIDFFKTGRIDRLTKNVIDDMSDTDFSRRAYSWRKRETILRNLKILEEERHD